MSKMYVPYASNIEKYKNRHEIHNQLILSKLREFQSTNNLNSKDFVVTGSSCGSYMNYFITKHIRDVDIIISEHLDKRELTYTRGIDILKTDFIPQHYRHPYILKDGFYFMSPEDLLVHATMKGLVNMKFNSIEYMGQLLRYLNLSVYEFQPRFESIILESSYFPERTKTLIYERMWLLVKWHGR